jgi:hypothetical protein
MPRKRKLTFDRALTIARMQQAKSWELRAVEHPVPDRALGGKAAFGQPLPQAVLKFNCEIISRRKVLKRRQELPASCLEPGVEETLEPLPLRLYRHLLGIIDGLDATSFPWPPQVRWPQSYSHSSG